MKDFDKDTYNRENAAKNDSVWNNVQDDTSNNLNTKISVSIQKNYRSTDHLIAIVKAYKPRYDYGSWSYVITELEKLWSEIAETFRNGMSIRDHTLVSNLFLEIRRFMQLTKKPLRVEVAKWLVDNLDKRDGTSVKCRLSALNLLAWIYTSCGIDQNLDLARHYLQSSLALYERESDLIPIDMVAELYENLIRVDVRLRKLESAQRLIVQGRERVFEIHSHSPVDRPRLVKRCLIPFDYNRGLIHYLKDEYFDAKHLFQHVRDEAELIGWKRVEAGAMSWLATIAKQQHLYKEGQDLLADIEIPDEQRKAYIHSVLAAIADAQGNREEARRQKQDASVIFKRYNVRYEDMMTLDLAISDC